VNGPYVACVYEQSALKHPEQFGAILHA
jgi:hypothetical protein